MGDGALTGGGDEKTGKLAFPSGFAGAYYLYCWINTLDESPVCAALTVDAKGNITKGLYDKAGGAPLGYRLFVAEGDGANTYALTMLGRSLTGDATTTVIYLTDPDDISTCSLVSEGWGFVTLTGTDEVRRGTITLPKGAPGGYCIYAGISGEDSTLVYSLVIADENGVVTSGLVEPPTEGGATASPEPTATPEPASTPGPAETPAPSATPAETDTGKPPTHYTLFGGSTPAGLGGGGNAAEARVIVLYPYIAAGLALVIAAALVIIARKRKNKER